MGGELQSIQPRAGTTKRADQQPVIRSTRHAQGYQRAGLLSAEDVNLIQRVAGQRSQADKILEEVRCSPVESTS